MSNLRIALVQERPGQAYYSGSTITGNVLLDLAEARNYKYVSIQFVGRSYVHWEERRSESSGNQQRHVTYRYTSEHQCADQVSSDGKLGAAKYSWPFSFAIPPLAPSFFEGTVGNIYATPSKPESGRAYSSSITLSRSTFLSSNWSGSLIHAYYCLNKLKPRKPCAVCVVPLAQSP